MRSHEARRTELVTDGGRNRFRAVCSCGWKSEPIDAGSVVLVWEAHAEGARGAIARPLV